VRALRPSVWLIAAPSHSFCRQPVKSAVSASWRSKAMVSAVTRCFE